MRHLFRDDYTVYVADSLTELKFILKAFLTPEDLEQQLSGYYQIPDDDLYDIITSVNHMPHGLVAEADMIIKCAEPEDEHSTHLITAKASTWAKWCPSGVLCAQD